jgi:cytochrome P450
MSDTATAAELYYHPCDLEIDKDPYPIWQRLRDEAPLYYNEKDNFYALSRWDDVELALLDWKTYRSGKGTIFEVITADIDIPPGIILWEDPPMHDLHREVLTRVFTPKAMNDIEPLVRRFCVDALDALAGADGFDVIKDFAALLPMRTIGYLLGIPEQDQQAIRNRTDEVLDLQNTTGSRPNLQDFDGANDLVADYIDWRAKHPSDDLMTKLLYAEIEENGERRRLTRTEVLTYIMMIAGAGNETAARLIGFTAQLLADHPDQRRQIAQNSALIPPAIEEVLRYEAPSPVQCRYLAQDMVHHGRTVPKEAIMLLLNGAANRDERYFENPNRFDIHRKTPSRPHLTFGYGLHHCMGAALARLEGRVALDEMLKRWPEWDVDYSGAQKAHTSSVRGWASLPIKIKSR